MAGEMSKSGVTRESFPLHFAISDALKGEVRPFDVYQGPYVLTANDRLFVQSVYRKCDHGCEHETGEVQIWSERLEELSDPFWPSDLDWAKHVAINFVTL